MMTRMTVLQGAWPFLGDVGEDVLWHATRLAQGSFDLAMLLAIGLLIYLTGIETAAAGLHGRPLFGVQVKAQMPSGAMLTASHAPSSCGLTNDLLPTRHSSCIQAMVLEPGNI